MRVAYRRQWLTLSAPVLALLGLSYGQVSPKTNTSTRNTPQQRADAKSFPWDWQRVQVGPLGDGHYVEATTQVITPAGKNVVFYGRPEDLALDASEHLVAVKNTHGLAFIDAKTGKIIQALNLPPDPHFLSLLGGNGFHGIAWETNGKKVWLTDSFGTLRGAAEKPDGSFEWSDAIVLPGPAGPNDPSVPGGIAIDSTRQRIWVTLTCNNAIGMVNPETKKVEMQIPVSIAPYGVVLAGDLAFVSNWGGRPPRDNDDFTAESSGTQTVIDARTGVASTGTVSVVDLAKGKVLTEIEVGLHPSDMVLSHDGKTLYVANTNSDSVSVIDVATKKVTATIGTKPQQDLPPGSAPNALALSNDDTKLYVANGGNNAIAVIDLSKGTLQGLIPTGWYPSALAVGRSGNLFVANLKGVGSRGADFGFPRTYRTKRSGGHNVYDFSGSVSIVEPPSPEQLKSYTSQVADNMRLSRLAMAGHESGGGKEVPVPTRPGERSVFKHVLYIIKENRTYDAILGDLKGGNGDPTFTLFGSEITPNHHALAAEFALLDNLYCNGTLSAQGHQWTDEGYATDYVEKMIGGYVRSYPADGTDPIAYSPAGFIWDEALAKGLTFRIYGEFLKGQLSTAPKKSWQDLYEDYQHNQHSVRFLQGTEVETLLPYVDWQYPAFSLEVPDVYRAQEFINEIHKFEQIGELPNLMVLQLGNDHTSGTAEGVPTPRAAVADNDLALGQIVEAVSKSKFWKDTVIFVVEDDSQDGLDHVDGQRTVGFVASAYNRRHYHDSTFYNQNSILRTIELILGLDPMTQFDLAANPMVNLFQETADLSPYETKPNQVPLAEFNPKRAALSGLRLRDAQLSQQMDFTKPDEADEHKLNLILWHAAKGYTSRYPSLKRRAQGR